MNVLKTTKSNRVFHNNENINETCVIFNMLMQDIDNTLQKLMFLKINEHTNMTRGPQEWICL